MMEDYDDDADLTDDEDLDKKLGDDDYDYADGYDSYLWAW